MILSIKIPYSKLSILPILSVLLISFFLFGNQIPYFKKNYHENAKYIIGVNEQSGTMYKKDGFFSKRIIAYSHNIYRTKDKMTYNSNILGQLKISLYVLLITFFFKFISLVDNIFKYNLKIFLVSLAEPVFIILLGTIIPLIPILQLLLGMCVVVWYAYNMSEIFNLSILNIYSQLILEEHIITFFLKNKYKIKYYHKRNKLHHIKCKNLHIKIDEQHNQNQNFYSLSYNGNKINKHTAKPLQEWLNFYNKNKKVILRQQKLNNINVQI